MDEHLLLQTMTVFTGVAAVALVIMMIALVVVARTSLSLRARTLEFLDRWEPVADSAKDAVEQTRKQSTDILANIKKLTESGKQQMDKVDTLLTEVQENARIHMERIDQTVELSLKRVNDTTSAVQSTILVPVQQIRGVAAAVTAVLSHLAGKPPPTVDQATIDEEMFI